MGIDINLSLNYYKRKDIQQAILRSARGREVAVKANDRFLRRPDILSYENEVFDFAKKGATSFHLSEELWLNALELKPSMSRKDLNALRKGWDLIIDVDSKHWELAKVITYLITKVLEEQGIFNYSVKFSGNKGFHIGLAYESFPKEVYGQKIKDLFPELPQKIAKYIIDYIEENYLEVNKKENSVVFDNKYFFTIKELEDISSKDLFVNVCRKCNNEISEIKEETYFLCPSCGLKVPADKGENYKTCPNCNKLIPPENRYEDKLCPICRHNEFYEKLNTLAIIEVDTLLISQRHMFRSPYSLHEKSGLVSVPIKKDEILSFNKESAKPEAIKPGPEFMNRNVKENEAYTLFLKALDFSKKKEEYNFYEAKQKEYKIITKKTSLELFPPCIKKILEGLEDGKKGALFILINFLSNVGWSYDDIKDLILEWNSKNNPPLRENIIIGQLNYHKSRKQKILPPNCANNMYYKDLGICSPDRFCKFIKNPVNYVNKRLNKTEPPNKK